jgi:hypothetical protein
MLVMVVTNFKDKGIQVAIVLQNRRVAIFILFVEGYIT